MKILNVLAVVTALTLSCFVPAWTVFGFDQQPVTLPITSIYDGDTLRTELPDSTLPAQLRKVSVRVYGIDTPERGHRAKCDRERELAEEAKTFVEDFIGLKPDHTVYMVVVDPEHDKYGGRILGKVLVHGKDLGRLLIKNGYAYEYYGDAKQNPWC